MDDMSKKVAGSLEYGVVFGRRWQTMFSFGIAAFLLAAGVWIVLIFTEGRAEGAGGLAVVFILNALMYIGFATWFVVLLVKNQRLLKKIKVWMQDAVPYTVFAEKADEDRTGVHRVRHYITPAVRIAVRFRYQGRRITRFSGEGQKGVNTRDGYSPGWYKYCNREIDILYSPKYDQVIVLKDPDR